MILSLKFDEHGGVEMIKHVLRQASAVKKADSLKRMSADEVKQLLQSSIRKQK